MRILFVLAFVAFLTSCSSVDSLDPSEFEVNVAVEPKASSFAISEGVTVRVTNNSERTVFVADYCPPRAEVDENGEWREVHFADVMCTAEVVVPTPVDPGDVYRVGISPRILEAGEVIEGRYRLFVSVGKDEQESVEIPSTPFQLVTQGNE